jgi:choline dehydrogenase-like flavoprotein
MFLDGRQVELGARIETDLCIVGAGAAGLTLACQFAGMSTRVCLIESGGLDFDWQTQSLYEGGNVGLKYFDLDVCQLRYFGGNTNGWGGWCRPLDAIDFRERPWVKDSGWPFPLAELEPYYRSAHSLCEIAEPEYDPERTARSLGKAGAQVLPFDPSKVETSIYRFSRPTRFGQVYRQEIANAQNITCLLHANVLKINVSDNATRVTDVEVGALSGTRFKVSAAHFVLTAGGIENCRLLLLSNDVAPRGIGNQNDLVGRYFMEHPHTKRVLIAKSRKSAVSLYGLKFRDHGVSARLSLSETAQRELELLNYSGNIHPIYFAHDSSGWLSLRKLVLSLDPSRACDPFVRFPPYGRKGLSFNQVAQIARQIDRVTIAALLQVFQPDRLISGFVLESKSEQAPNPNSRVTLDHERDAFGLNRVRLDWRMLPIDQRTLAYGENIIDGELRRLGVGELARIEEPYVDGWPSNLEGGWHQIGTTRAHIDPRRGVVDGDCKVHGMSNLFIGGSSVFSTAGAAPPTLTIVALALRLANHLRNTIAMERQSTVSRNAPMREPEWQHAQAAAVWKGDIPKNHSYRPPFWRGAALLSKLAVPARGKRS